MNHIQLYHKDSRTLEAAKKCVPKRVEMAKFTLVLTWPEGKGHRQHKRYP